MDFLTGIFGIGFVLFWVGKVVHHFFFAKKKRMLWAGSVPITNEELRDWYATIWWETYQVIAPEDRVNHTPTPHWLIYKDAEVFLPSYLGVRLIGWWAMEQRAIFVTDASKKNRNLIRHECAHDIMNSIQHSAKYFSLETYVMNQFR